MSALSPHTLLLISKSNNTISIGGEDVPKGGTELHQAAREDDAEKARDYLSSINCDINARNETGETALHHATSATANHISIQDPPYDPKDKKWDILMTDTDKKTSVAEANFYGYSFVANLLLSDKRCDVNAVNKTGSSALHIAAADTDALRHIFPILPIIMYDWRVAIIIHEQRTILPQLLTHPSIDVNIQDREGRTALHLACLHGNSLAIQRLLRDPRCNVTLRDVDGQTATHMAVSKYPHINSSFDTRADIYYETPPLEYIFQSERVVETLTVLDNMGESVVSLFIRNLGVIRHYKDAPSIPEFFLSALTPEAVNAAKHTLALAVEISSSYVCRQLLDQGADASSVSVYDEPALFCAIRLNSLPKCKLLVEYKAYLTVTWKEMSPLQYAIAHGCKSEILELLSKEHTMAEIQHDLQKHAIADETPLTASVRLRVLPWIKHFATKENIQVPDATGRSALELSCRDPCIHRFVSSLCEETISDNTKTKLEEMKQWYIFVKNCQTTIRASNDEIDALEIPEFMKNPSRSSVVSDIKAETEQITEYVLRLLLEISHVIETDKEMSHFAFHPSIAGSMSEGTKAFMPNELDTVCLLKNGGGLALTNASTLGCSLTPDKDSPFHSMCVLGRVEPKQLADAFYTCVARALRELLGHNTNIGNLHIPQHCLCLKEKISCLHLLWRGQIYKDMVIHVDLAPAFGLPEQGKAAIVKGLPKPVPLVGDYKSIDIIAKQPRHGSRPTVDFHVSYTQTETAFFQALPENIKSGFRFAKAMRISAYCNLVDMFRSDETVSTEDYVTTFMLKMTLLRLMYNFGDRPAINFTDMSIYEVADALYADIENGAENRRITSFYSEQLFECRQYPRYQKDCCFKREAILAICRRIREWIKSNHLVYSRA